MANKVPWHTTLDWKDITGIIALVVILGIVALFLFLPNVIQDNKLTEYPGETTGSITSTTENTEMNQGPEGTKIYVGSYTVNYFYQVNEEIYTGSERIKATANATRILNKIISSQSREVTVRYDTVKVARSTIVIE
jgi:hypothetical protein